MPERSAPAFPSMERGQVENKDTDIPTIQYDTPLTELNPLGLKKGDVIVVTTPQGDKELEVANDVTPGLGLGVYVDIYGHRQYESVINRTIHTENSWLTLVTDSTSSTKMMVSSILVRPAAKS